ncbi:UNVERIFIED_CONTAM: hypothetical protein Sangu_2440300 [Sesamum angustifolium]|uniref:Reverse transcriptase domain-containing protein n=1 Tax=Sesamum angustifolium TaxID=2727405 RepID=A0AAW2L0I1_9LAMI
MKDNPKRVKSEKYCRFHRDRGYTTEECHHLMNELEKLIQRGCLKEYTNQGPSRQPQDSISAQTRNTDNLPTTGVIVVISRGPTGGDSANARKALARATRGNHWQAPIQVYNVNSENQEEISFNSQDMDPMRNQNNDALVISATLANFLVKKVLVDSGSSADIIFYDTYVQLGIDNAQLWKVNTPLTGFSGSIRLQHHLGETEFKLFRAIASTFHMELKFPTSVGVGDELMARVCYVNTLKRSRKKLDGKAPNAKGKRVMIGIEHEAEDTP